MAANIHTRVMNLLPRPHVVWILTVLAVTVSLSILFRSGAQHRSNSNSNSSSNSNSNQEIVVSVEIVAENRTIQQYTYREQEAYYKDLPTWLDRYSFLPAPNEVPDDQRVCLVHVGEWFALFLFCSVFFQRTRLQVARCLFQTNKNSNAMTQLLYVLIYLLDAKKEKQPATRSAAFSDTRRPNATIRCNCYRETCHNTPPTLCT